MSLKLISGVLIVWVLFAVMTKFDFDLKKAAERKPRITEFDHVIDQMPWGNIAYNAPAQMEYGKPVQIQLLLSPELSTQQLAKMVEGDGEMQRYTIKISDEMTAQLSGDGFKIEQIGEKTQPVASKGTTQWEWTVTGESSGEHSLILILEATLQIKGKEERKYTIRTFKQPIKVKVVMPGALTYFVKGNWKWLCAVVIIPVLPLLFGKKKKEGGGGEKKDDEEQKDEG